MGLRPLRVLEKARSASPSPEPSTEHSRRHRADPKGTIEPISVPHDLLPDWLRPIAYALWEAFGRQPNLRGAPTCSACPPNRLRKSRWANEGLFACFTFWTWMRSLFNGPANRVVPSQLAARNTRVTDRTVTDQNNGRQVTRVSTPLRRRNPCASCEPKAGMQKSSIQGPPPTRAERQCGPGTVNT